MIKSKHTEKYRSYVEAGQSYDEIRALAIKNGIKGDELILLMRDLDPYILERDEQKAIQRQAREMIWIGIAFCLIAGMMSLYSLINDEGHYIYLVYFIFLGGALIFYNGWKKKNYWEQQDLED